MARQYHCDNCTVVVTKDTGEFVVCEDDKDFGDGGVAACCTRCLEGKSFLAICQEANPSNVFRAASWKKA